MINLGLRRDGITGSLHTTQSFQMKMDAGFLYRSQLAQKLRERLGGTTEKEKTGLHIRGVPREVCEAFSKRRQAIVERLQGNAGDTIAANKATLATREAKKTVPSRSYANSSRQPSSA